MLKGLICSQEGYLHMTVGIQLTCGQSASTLLVHGNCASAGSRFLQAAAQGRGSEGASGGTDCPPSTVGSELVLAAGCSALAVVEADTA